MYSIGISSAFWIYFLIQVLTFLSAGWAGISYLYWWRELSQYRVLLRCVLLCVAGIQLTLSFEAGYWVISRIVYPDYTAAVAASLSARFGYALNSLIKLGLLNFCIGSLYPIWYVRQYNIRHFYYIAAGIGIVSVTVSVLMYHTVMEVCNENPHLRCHVGIRGIEAS